MSAAVFGVVLRLALAGVLLAAAAGKLARPAASREGLSTFGLRGAGAQRVGLVAVVAWELVLAAGVAMGLTAAALAAALTLLVFGGALALALVRGRAGAPCACFGSGSRVSVAAVARNLALAAAFAALPFLPATPLSAVQWLGIGLALALVGVLGLAVAVLALAREVGVLRMQLAPQSALEIPEEGPELGSRTDLVERFELGEADLALAVFTSEGCRMCQALEPAVAALARHPAVDVRTFDEASESDVWRRLDVPGSPFAVVLDAAGTVLAKGTFNTMPQLEGVVATAERRARERVGA